MLFSLENGSTTHTLFVVLILIWFLRMLGAKKNTAPPSLPPPPSSTPPPPVVIPPYTPPPVVSDPTPPTYQPKLTPEQQTKAWIFVDSAFPSVGRAARDVISDYQYAQAHGQAALPGTYKNEFLSDVHTYEQQVWGPGYFKNLKNQDSLGEWFHTQVFNGKKAVKDLFGAAIVL